MRILVTGATGFLGNAIVATLLAAGHQVVACVHRRPARLPPGVEAMTVDYMRDIVADAWRPRLTGVDAVINSVGILREHRNAEFASLHNRAPRALFTACEREDVRRMIQISALGADDAAAGRYHRSKKAADDALRASALDWTIVQPSLVFGARGNSTRLLLALASLPLVPVAGAGDQTVQPVHIDDLATLILRLVTERSAIRETVAAVGADAVTFRDLLAAYRHALGLPSAPTLAIPAPTMRLAARLGDFVHRSPLSTETLAMLERGNSASTQAIARILRRPPLGIGRFVATDQAPALRRSTTWSWVRLLLLAGIALTWIAAGVVSALYGHSLGLRLLAKLGLTGGAAEVAFATACTLDVGLGIATVLHPVRTLWLIQLLVVAFYTVTLSVVAPQLWVDPFGPLMKNLPIVAVLTTLVAMDDA